MFPPVLTAFGALVEEEEAAAEALAPEYPPMPRSICDGGRTSLAKFDFHNVVGFGRDMSGLRWLMSDVLTA